MQTITPFLWFDTQAEEAAQLYVSIFKNSTIGMVSRYPEGGPGPAGTAMVVALTLNGRDFTLLNGGPTYSCNPSISFFVTVETEEEATRLWEALIKGGKALMEFGPYPFSKKYGWLDDKYGVSWQISVGEGGPSIRPLLMFTQGVNGKADEAMKFYSSLFPDSGIDFTARYEAGMPNAGNIMHAAFHLNGQRFLAMDGGTSHAFTFSEGVSLAVNCDGQGEIDDLWNKLSAHPENEQCGWLKDKYGVSWQIIPSEMGEIMSNKDPAKAQKTMQAMMQMKKLDIAALKKAGE